MRIAVVQPNLTWVGGVEKFLSSVLTRLSRENEVAIFSFQFDSAALPDFNAINVHVVGGMSDFGGHLKTYLRSRRFERLFDALREWRPDVVLIQQFSGIQLTGWLGSRLPGVPVIPYVHDTWSLRMMEELKPEVARPAGALNRIYNGFTSRETYTSSGLGDAKLVACVSRFIQGPASKLWSGVEVRVIYNGVDHDYFSPTWEDEGFALCVSRIERGKNLDLVFEAFQNAPFPVVVCGSVPKGIRYSKEYAQDLLSRAKGPIQLMINQDGATVRRLLQKCSLVLQPGKDEGFGLVSLEGMACGKAVIAHRSGGTIEVVDGGGILLGDDGREWRRVVDELMASPESRKELGKRGLAQSMTFSWDRTSEQILELCNDALGHTSRPGCGP
jgi:glycosyltransferase involved in cell wall biosynthesis